MIHQYKNNGYDIVMDVNSGSVHVVDDLIYDMVEVLNGEIPELDEPQKLPKEAVEKTVAALKDRYPEAEIREAMEDIQELIDREELFTKDTYSQYVTDFKQRKTVVKALCLHIAHDCNLACRYCFAEEGEYHGRRALMSYEVGKKALDFLIANSGTRRNLEVDFFGGEPLMNWDVVKRLVEYGRSQEEAHNKKFRFTITTNGVLLNDAIMDFCNKEMSNVVLSLDGRPEVNDYMRPFRNGTGSYDLIVPKLQKFAKRRGTIMSAAPLPEEIWIFPRMCSTLRIWALRRCLLSRWYLCRMNPLPFARKICLRSWRSMTLWRRSTSDGGKRGEALPSSTL